MWEKARKWHCNVPAAVQKTRVSVEYIQ
jgi:hypothetical protein